MATIFKYNDKTIQCMNLQKKLKKMKIAEDNIEILWQGEATQSELESKFLELTNTKKEKNYGGSIDRYEFTDGVYTYVSFYEHGTSPTKENSKSVYCKETLNVIYNFDPNEKTLTRK